ncbi:MAG: hypothetical protein JOZ53_23325 [Planctomycetaceae bacterium]|nr:hypothetical protein [Planctomycetaceae bacterium]
MKRIPVKHINVSVTLPKGALPADVGMDTAVEIAADNGLDLVVYLSSAILQRVEEHYGSIRISGAVSRADDGAPEAAAPTVHLLGTDGETPIPAPKRAKQQERRASGGPRR